MDIGLGLFAISSCAIAALWVKVRDLRFRVEGLERELELLKKVVCTDDEVDFINYAGLFGRDPEVERMRLQQVIDRRADNNLPTIICTNLAEKELVACCGGRISSRLHKNCYPLKFLWNDYRKSQNIASLKPEELF